MFDYSDISKQLAVEIHSGIAEKPPRKIKLPKTLAVIDQSGCTGCEACIQFCPVDCIELVPGPTYPDMNKMVEVDLDRCIGCKLCAKYCPWDTIHMIASAESYEKANEWTLRSVIDLDKVEKPDLAAANIWPRPEPVAPEAVAAAEPATDTPKTEA